MWTPQNQDTLYKQDTLYDQNSTIIPSWTDSIPAHFVGSTVFYSPYVPSLDSQAVSGPKEERKERVLWARFEVGEMNDLSLPHHSETRGSNGGHVPLPLLLILGLSSGYSIWMIMVCFI